MKTHSFSKYMQTVLLIFCIPLVVFANDPADVITITDVFELETITDPQISPDGKKIVYVRQFADVMTDRYYSNLWSINFDGTDNRPLTTGHYNDTSPRWSPDGKRLIFISNRDGSPQIYLRWMDTGQLTKLTNLQHAPSGISWSPDGSQIAFASLVPSDNPSLIKMPQAPKGAKTNYQRRLSPWQRSLHKRWASLMVCRWQINYCFGKSQK